MSTARSKGSIGCICNRCGAKADVETRAFYAPGGIKHTCGGTFRTTQTHKRTHKRSADRKRKSDQKG